MADTNYTIQNGLADPLNPAIARVSDSVDYSEFAQFLGGMDVTNQNLKNVNPFVRGIARIHLYRPCVFMEKMFPQMTKTFKQYLETGYKRVDGISDLSGTFTDFEGGFAARRYSKLTQVRDDTESITIAAYEQSGSLLKNYVETWMTGIVDPVTGLTHYHGAIDREQDPIPYGEQNHSAEFIYYTLDPTGRKIEYACMLAHAVPTRAQKNHLNFEAGQKDNVEYELEFNVTKYESRAINDIATFYLANTLIKQTYLQFNPNITEADVKGSLNLAAAS